MIEWHWWIVAALAFIYGVAVMALVLAMLAKSIRAEEQEKKIERRVFPGQG